MTIQNLNLASKMNPQNSDAAFATLSAGHVTVVSYPSMSADKMVAAEAAEALNHRLNAGAISEAAIRSDVDGVSTGSLALRMSAPIARSQTSSLLLQASDSTSRKLPATGGEGEEGGEEGGGGAVDGKPSQRPRASVERRNRRERLRVKQINNTFVTLRNQLPSASWSPKQRNAKKFSKVDTLRLAIEYIRGLQQVIRDHDAMYMSAECLALLSSPAARVGGEGGVGNGPSSSSSSFSPSPSPYSSSAAFLDSASDRSGAESVSSSVPDQQSSGHSLLTDFLTGLGHSGGGSVAAADDLFDAFFLDDCSYFVS